MIADLNVMDMPRMEAPTACPCHADDAGGARGRFGPKVRDWNRTEMVERWRERWAELANERLAELDIDARIDHRSLEAQASRWSRKARSARPAQRIEGEGIEATDRAEMHREIARGNGARSSRIPIWAWTRSRSSNRPLRGAI